MARGGGGEWGDGVPVNFSPFISCPDKRMRKEVPKVFQMLYRVLSDPYIFLNIVVFL